MLGDFFIVSITILSFVIIIFFLCRYTSPQFVEDNDDDNIYVQTVEGLMVENIPDGGTIVVIDTVL